MNKYYEVNYRIKATQMRVISHDGENLGVLSLQDAMNKAKEQELDLVLIGPTANPPVAKIMSFDKFLYEERKKRSSTKSKKSELKELKLGPTTGEGDVMRIIDRALEFLAEGDRVKVSVILKGRQAMYPKLAFEKLERVITELAPATRVEEPPKMIGKVVSVIFVKK